MPPLNSNRNWMKNFGCADRSTSHASRPLTQNKAIRSSEPHHPPAAWPTDRHGGIRPRRPTISLLAAYSEGRYTYEPEGREFESLRERHFPNKNDGCRELTPDNGLGFTLALPCEMSDSPTTRLQPARRRIIPLGAQQVHYAHLTLVSAGRDFIKRNIEAERDSSEPATKTFAKPKGA